MRVLAIGDSSKDLAREVYASVEDLQVDVTTLLPGKKRGDYDCLIASMILPLVSYRKVVETVKAWADALREGGEMLLIVPSLEWAAYQILSPDHTPGLAAHLFGPQDNPSQVYASGYTMMDLRKLCEMCGIAVTHAKTGVYMIDEYECGSHSIRGIKKGAIHAATVQGQPQGKNGAGGRKRSVARPDPA